MDSLKSARFSPQWLVGALGELGITGADSLLLGFSGGLDSTALLHGLSQLNFSSVRAVYVNHGLQAEATVWGKRATETAQSYGISCEVINVLVTVDGQGVEDAARRARYSALAACMSPEDVLLTAHHADDQAETVLLQLLRGTGLAGTAGIAPITPFGKGRLARPLLGVTREALADYVAREGLSFVADASNADVRFARNYIRHMVWPLLRERWPRGQEAMARGARHIQEAHGLLASYVAGDIKRCTDGRGRLILEPLLALSQTAQAWVLRGWIGEQGARPPATETCHKILADIRITPRSRQQVIRLAGGGVMLRYRNTISWRSSFLPSTLPPLERGTWQPPGPYVLGGWDKVLVAREVLGQGVSVSRLRDRPVAVESRVAGVRVCIPGRGHRTLKKFLQELAIPPWERPDVVFVFDGDALMAVPGYWVCQSYKARPDELGWLFAVEAQVVGGSESDLI